MTSRRTFLEALAGVGVGLAVPRLGLAAHVAAGPAGVADDGYGPTSRASGPHRWTVGAVESDLKPGLIIPGLGYNGRSPGPTVWVDVGGSVDIQVENTQPAPTTVHWHGLILPNDMDGVPGITQAPILEGQSFRYRFAAMPAGTRWYHSHVSPQLAQGLFGAMVVRDPHDPPVDHDVMVTLHDLPDWSSYHAAMAGVSDAMPYTPPGIPDPMMTAGGGMARMGDEVAYRAHALNGKAVAQRLRVKPHDRVRLRLLNTSPTETRFLRFAGERVDVTHTDGNPLSHPLTVDVLALAPAQRLDVHWVVPGEGSWTLAGLTRPSTYGEQALTLATAGSSRFPTRLPAVDCARALVFSDTLAGGHGVAAPAPRGTYEAHLVLDQAAHGPGWTINGKVWPHTPKLTPRFGQTVRVSFENRSDMDHPMHLHGHVFSVLSVNGQWLAAPPVRDTSVVPAHGRAIWQFTANTFPGRWLLHCHNEIHMMGGMMTEVVYG